MLGQRISARQPFPTCLLELRRALLGELCNIPQDQIDNLILSRPRRCVSMCLCDEGIPNLLARFIEIVTLQQDDRKIPEHPPCIVTPVTIVAKRNPLKKINNKKDP
ncbi:hypothetical protein TNCV_2732781 [Trichonephila clavipes]|nr:hypothetical protein TNCV_2732781 [Trichonephila clavipes]